ncbi:MAG: zinc metallopeptidase [Bacteroidia bacterium]|nr:MAG: zinc metallopeptidase [Bacteroidia bacterium]
MVLNMEMLIIFGVFALLSWLVSNQLKSRFAKYSRMRLRSGLSGREIAEKMLRESGVDNVRVISTPGRLTDHYNPANRTVNLSPEVYNGRSIAAAAVAAHECGHAVQHARAYAFLKMRSALVPVISVSSRYMMWILLIGILTVESMPGILLAGIVMFAATTLFSFITLPVEFDATKRALAWLTNTGMTVGEEYSNAKDALKWAALTYVVAALASLATLLYYIMIFMGRRN